MKILKIVLLLVLVGQQCVAKSKIERTFADDEYVQTRAGLVFDILDRANEIKVKTDTLKIGLSQDDVVAGTLTLYEPGAYILVDNIVADVVIAGMNVTLDLSGKSLIGTILVSGSVTIIKNGAIVVPPPTTPTEAATPALTIAQTASMVRVKACHITCLSSQSTDEYESLAGRVAIQVSGAIVDIQGCSIGSGSGSDTTTVSAQDGATAIIIDESAKKVRIGDCIMVSGNGGSALVGTGGSGGHGIEVKDSTREVEIKNSTIFQTGNGGIPDGNGGSGIVIESTAADVCVYDCHIRNTGQGDGAGVGGKAIHDAVTAVGDRSIIYRNVAHNIANSVKFDLQGAGVEKGILSPNPPDSTLINLFANIYLS